MVCFTIENIQVHDLAATQVQVNFWNCIFPCFDMFRSDFVICFLFLTVGLRQTFYRYNIIMICSYNDDTIIIYTFSKMIFCYLYKSMYI